ncbi:unnamed protein product [Schistosoma haematobium]|nr:unnamed protein product [Schistosoma haematobium]
MSRDKMQYASLISGVSFIYDIIRINNITLLIRRIKRGGRQSVFVFYTICTHFARLPENILVKTIFKHT